MSDVVEGNLIFFMEDENSGKNLLNKFDVSGFAITFKG